MTEAKVKITVKGGYIYTRYSGNKALAINAMCCELASAMARQVMLGMITKEKVEEGFQKIKEKFQHDLSKMEWEMLYGKDE